MYKGQLSYSVAFNVIMTDELYLLAPADRLMTKRDMYLATLYIYLQMVGKINVSR